MEEEFKKIFKEIAREELYYGIIFMLILVISAVVGGFVIWQIV